MRYRIPAFAAFLALVALLHGCGPSVVCTVETAVLPDYTCRRVLRMNAYANPRFPNQRIRLGDYFQFPPAELYETYLAQPDKAVFAGVFNSYETIPPDLVRFTPGSQKLGGNAFSFRAIDLVVAVLADFDETIHDIIVGREDGEAALNELVRLLVPEVMSVLNARYGQRFDLTRFEAWMQNDLPAKLRRIYAGVWNIHNSRRSGVASPGEDYEIYTFVKAEAEREGLALVDPGAPDFEKENIRRAKEFAAQLAERLCPPRQAGGAPLSRDMQSSTIGDELLGALQKAVTARHGSINEFLRKIGELIPRAFGSYLTPRMMPIYMLPDAVYFYRLKVPGQVLQTNAVRDLNGDLVWTFADRDIALSGQSMWARTVYVREAVTLSLGLRGFPENLAEIDRLFGLCVDEQGRPRQALLIAMQQSAAARSLHPLETVAGDLSLPDSQAARGVLELFAKYRRKADSDPSPKDPGDTELSPPPPPSQPRGSAADSPKPSPEPAAAVQPSAMPPADRLEPLHMGNAIPAENPPPLRESDISEPRPQASAQARESVAIPDLPPPAQARPSTPASLPKESPTPELSPPTPSPQGQSPQARRTPQTNANAGIIPPPLPPPIR